MQTRHALSSVTTVALLLLTGCSAGIGSRLSNDSRPSEMSGSASDDGYVHENEHEHHDHSGHEHHHHTDAHAEPAPPSHAAPPPAHVHVEGTKRGISAPRYGRHAHALGAGHGHGGTEHDSHAHAAGGHDHARAPRRLLRRNLQRGWCAPAEHYHLSACGTPYVHGFLTEPAFLGRDLFVDFSRSDDETEIETEIEWSLTRRLGVIAELPYIDAEASGFGDAALGLRALLVEERRFLLSASTEIELPTGSESRGLGSGAIALGASLHTWTDLGSWVTLQTVTGIEHVPDEDETEFKWSVALAKSFRACPLIRTPSHGGHDHGPTTFNLIAEIAGVTALSGDAGTTEGRWLLGASYPLMRSLDVRGGFSRTFGGDEDEEAWTVGFIFHF